MTLPCHKNLVAMVTSPKSSVINVLCNDRRLKPLLYSVCRYFLQNFYIGKLLLVWQIFAMVTPLWPLHMKVWYLSFFDSGNLTSEQKSISISCMFLASFSPNLVPMVTSFNHSLSKMFRLDRLTSKTPLSGNHVIAIFDKFCYNCINSIISTSYNRQPVDGVAQ